MATLLQLYKVQLCIIHDVLKPISHVTIGIIWTVTQGGAMHVIMDTTINEVMDALFLGQMTTHMFDFNHPRVVRNLAPVMYAV